MKWFWLIIFKSFLWVLVAHILAFMMGIALTSIILIFVIVMGLVDNILDYLIKTDT